MVDQALEKSSANKPIVLKCLSSVLQEITHAATDAEATGLLLGTRDETGVRVLAFRRFVPKRSLGRFGELSDSDRDAVARLIAGPPAEGELYGLEALGWFRAQPRRDLTLAEWELDLLNEFFKQPRQLGMVLRPAGVGPARARFYVRESGEFRMNTYRELTVPVSPDSHMVAIEPQAARPHPSARPVAWPPQPLAIPPEPALATSPGRPWRRWIWRTASAVATTALVIGYWLISSPRDQVHRIAAQTPSSADDRQTRPLPPEALDISPNRPNGDLAEIARSADRWDADEDSRYARRIAELNKQLKELEDQNPQLKEFGTSLSKPPDNAKTPENAKAPENAKTPESTKAPEKLSAPQREIAARDAGRSERTAPIRPPETAQSRPLRPLPSLPSSVINAKPVELAAPPLVAREATPMPASALPQAITVTPPPRPLPKTPPAVVPSSGTLIWTGRLRKNATVILDGKNASLGALVGALPGRPIQFRVYPGDLTDNGILVFTASSQDARRGWDAPGPQNGWNRVIFEFDPRAASGVEVEESPTPGNGWRRIVLRCTNPRLSVIYVKWSLLQ
jgi:hypothetical protein